MRENIIADYDYSSLQVALASVCKGGASLCSGFERQNAFVGCRAKPYKKKLRIKKEEKINNFKECILLNKNSY